MTHPAMMFLLQYVLDHLPLLSGVRVGKKPAAAYGDTGSAVFSLWWLSCCRGNRLQRAVMWCCRNCSEAVSQRPGEVWSGLSNSARLKSWAELDVLLRDPHTRWNNWTAVILWSMTNWKPKWPPQKGAVLMSTAPQLPAFSSYFFICCCSFKLFASMKFDLAPVPLGNVNFLFSN